MNNEKIRKEITFNTNGERKLYLDFKEMCNERGLNETSAIRDCMNTEIIKYKKEKQK